MGDERKNVRDEEDIPEWFKKLKELLEKEERKNESTSESHL